MISTKGRYAIKVMIDLAQQQEGDTYVPLKDIAARQSISKKYLEIIVKEMVAGGLVTGASGKGGGYRLCRAPEETTVWEVLELMEGPMNSVGCLADREHPCPREETCETMPMWVEFDKMVHDYFNGISISDLVAQQRS